MLKESFSLQAPNSQLQAIARQLSLQVSHPPPTLQTTSPLDRQKVIEWANDQISKENSNVRALASQINSMIFQWMAYRESIEETIQELNEVVQEKIIENQNLQEAVTHLQVKVESYQKEYSKLKNFTQNLAQNQRQNEVCWDTEKNQFEQTIDNMNEVLYTQNDKISVLTKEKEHFFQQVSQEKSKNDQLNQQLLKIKGELDEKMGGMTLLEQKILTLTREKEKIAASFAFCSQALTIYKKQIDKVNNEVTQSKAVSQKPCKKKTRHSSHIRQNLPYKSFYDFSWSYLQSQSRKNLKIQNELDCLSLDPYFAHFVLTSQSVKIREDCEELLNIDVKPYYHEIVEKRVPMHLWDQWIRNKLRELHRRNRKKSSGFTSEEEFP